jgi:hypothetical protein
MPRVSEEEFMLLVGWEVVQDVEVLSLDAV